MPRALVLAAVPLFHLVSACTTTPDPDRARLLADTLTSAETHGERRAAMWELLDMEEEAAPYLAAVLGREDGSEDPTYVGDWAAAALSNLGPESAAAVPDLIASLDGVDLTAMGPGMRMYALGRIGGPAVPDLVQALEKGSPTLQTAALLSLSYMDRDVNLRAAIPVATQLVGAADEELASAASFMLQQHPEQAVSELVVALAVARNSN